MSSISKLFCCLLSLLLLFVSCKTKQHAKADTPDSGTINISIDESFKPVMEAQIKMFEASYPNAHINATYKSEANCLKDFFSDSTNRMVIIGRALQSKEEKFMIDSLGYNPGCNKVATDAIAIVLNRNNKDSLFTLSDLEKKLTGKDSTQNLYVFDGLNATSTIRFIKDSILKGKEFNSKVVNATNSSEKVIEYVASHENAIGFVGISWIGNPENKEQVKLLQTVKLGYLRCDICDDKPFVKPMQESMITRRYPLTRGVYYAIKENYEGLGTGFVSFLKYERGQLIFKRAYLGPVMDFELRNVQINQKIDKK
jgi:phosphate transport system substrate-binding protein